MKKVRNETKRKQTIVAKVKGDVRDNLVRVGLAPGLNRISDEDWAAVMADEKARRYAQALLDEGAIDYDDEDDDGGKGSPKKKAKGKAKAKGKRAKGGDIDGL